ncbi:MAG: hypothetical protein EOP35_22125 [Rubrivivax sp.]|nr:MAG: hypothetical protein EOP35_22125 [Rubrivivax sp.]
MRARRRMDVQQLSLFSQAAPHNSGDCTSDTFVGPVRINPYRRHVLQMREIWAADAARRAGAAS